MARILAVLSSGYEEKEYKTGWWAEELFAPLLKLEEAGHTVDLASPLGGKPTLDERSISKDFDPNGTYKELVETGRADQTMKLEEVNASNYDAILVVGGHGAMFDLAKNVHLHQLMNNVYNKGGILAAECHGPSVFAFLKDKNEKLLIEGLDVTGYPDAIEPDEVLPFLPYSLEQELSKIANYLPEMDKKAYAVWANDQIVTSRDPFSSELMGDELVKKLNA